MKMKEEQKKIIKDLLDLCLEYNCDTFKCWLDFSGHFEYISLRYQTPSHENHVYIGGVSDSASHEHISGLTAAKAEHDKLYAPENLAATQEANRLAKIAKLQKQIDSLSNRDENLIKQSKGRAIRNELTGGN